MKSLVVITVIILLGIGKLFSQSKYEVPLKQFLGTWIVEKALYNPPEGKPQEEVKGKLANQEYLFKKGKKQALYRYFTDPKKWEYGITILEVSKTKLVFRGWSAHPSNKTIITLKGDGTAIVNDVYAKGEHVLHLKRPKHAEENEKKSSSEQGSAEQPAAAEESKALGKKKTQSESTGHSQ